MSTCVFIQAKFIEKSFLERAKNLAEQIKNLPKDCELAFLPANFLKSITDESINNVQSATALLFQEEREEVIKYLQNTLSNALNSNLTLVFFEMNKFVLLLKNSCEEIKISYHESEVSIKGKKISFSSKDFSKYHLNRKNKDCLLHIHYNTDAFYCGTQEKSEEFFKNFARENTLACTFLNSVYTCSGEIFHGQSFSINEQGELIERAKIFHEDILSSSGRKEKIIKNKEELIFNALVFAIREHIHNTGLTKAVLGLSGGMDSSLVAPLAVEALGKENVIGLLMPSPHSSDHSVNDAQALADNLGIKSFVLPIESMMTSYHNVLNPALAQCDIKQENMSLMQQNLQSRIRAMLIMAVANALPAFVLGTGNKSEEGMGYCTLYGDTCAGLFPIGDIYKTDVYTLGKWYNEYKGKEIIPHNCFVKAPSAELAPGQKDSDSLPEYAELDSFLFELLEEGKNISEINHSFITQTRINVMKKMKNAEFKREQSAPIIKLTNVTYGNNWK